MNRTLAYSIHTCSVDRSISMSCVSVTQPERRPCCAPLSVCKCPVVQSTAGAAQKSQNREWPSYGVSHSPLRLLYVSFGFAHQHRACQSVSVGNRNRSPALGSGSKVSQKSRNMTLWAKFFCLRRAMRGASPWPGRKFGAFCAFCVSPWAAATRRANHSMHPPWVHLTPFLARSDGHISCM